MTKKILFQTLAVAFIFAIVSGLRILGPGADVQEYKELLVYKVGSIEPFWEWIRNNFYINESDIFTFYAIVAFFSLLLKVPILLKAEKLLLIIPIYSVTFFILHEYIQIRIALGLGVAYVVLFNTSAKKFFPSIALYALPTLFHYSLFPICFIPFLKRKYTLLLFSLFVIAYIYAAEEFIGYFNYAESKFGDSSPFDVFNPLSTYFFIIHSVFAFRFAKLIPCKFINFYKASVVFGLICLPFGFLQYGTAFFRFQEISVSLLLPVLYATLSNLPSITKFNWQSFFGLYYILLSIKIFRDLLPY